MLSENIFSLNFASQYMRPKCLSPQYLWQVYATACHGILSILPWHTDHLAIAYWSSCRDLLATCWLFFSDIVTVFLWHTHHLVTTVSHLFPRQTRLMSEWTVADCQPSVWPSCLQPAIPRDTSCPSRPSPSPTHGRRPLLHKSIRCRIQSPWIRGILTPDSSVC